MSDKPLSKLDPLDILVRRTARCGMTDGTVMRIEFVYGFEKFNTRAYHNYETWGQGWRVTGLGVRVEREDLDDAVKLWAEHVSLLRAGNKVPRWVVDSGHVSPLLPDWIEPKRTDTWNDGVPVVKET
jgi:hypothetical protein